MFPALECGAVAMHDLEQWLENWVEENLQTPLYREDKSAMSAQAESCKSDAEKAGIRPRDVIAAAGGDLEGYLLKAQKRATEKTVTISIAYIVNSKFTSKINDLPYMLRFFAGQRLAPWHKDIFMCAP